MKEPVACLWICCRSFHSWPPLWGQEVTHSWPRPPTMSVFVFTLACAESSVEQLGLCHTPWQLPAVSPRSADRWVLRTVWMSRRADAVFPSSLFLFSHARAGGSWQRAARPGTSTLRRCWAARCWSSAVILTTTPLRATAPSASLLTSWLTISVRTGFSVASLVGHSVWPYRAV